MRRTKGKPAEDAGEGIELAALGCVLLATQTSAAEADALLQQLSPRMFNPGVATDIYRAAVALRMENHALDSVTLFSRLKHDGFDVAAQQCLKITDLVPSVWQFPEYLKQLKAAAHRRWLKAKALELVALADDPQLSAEAARAKLGAMFEDSDKADAGGKLVSVVTPREASSFVPNPEDFLVGEGLISRGGFLVIGGEAGAGKSRLLTTLAVAGGRGRGSWMGYPVRRRFRTLILQTENSGNRLKQELEAVTDDLADSFSISNELPKGMAFHNAEFRRAIRRIAEDQPFDLLGLDPWNDLLSEEGQSECAEAFAYIRNTFTGLPMPAVCIVAHLRKPRADASGRRKTGRELLHELSGTLKLGSTARTVFTVQPASYEMDDDRIVFELAKANDADPAWLKEFGTRSAWHRANAAFEPVKSFDWNEWLNPGQNNSERRALTIDMVREAMGRRPGMKTGELVEALCVKFDVGRSTAWRAIGKGGYLADSLHEVAGVVAVREAA